MFTLKIENANGERIELTHEPSRFYVTSISGLTRPQTNINVSTGGTSDGTFFNSARVNQRNIVISVTLNGDIEENRNYLYRVFPLKKPCWVFFENKVRSVKIQGYVEILDSNLFTERQAVQISIICPRPYFESLQEIATLISRDASNFEFPFSIEEGEPEPISELLDSPLAIINNSGDVECGWVINSTLPTGFTGLKIINSTTGEFIEFNYTFNVGDIVQISTVEGDLFAKVKRGSLTINILGYITQGSTWFKLPTGRNELTYTTGGASGFDIAISCRPLFGGV